MYIYTFYNVIFFLQIFKYNIITYLDMILIIFKLINDNFCKTLKFMVSFFFVYIFSNKYKIDCVNNILGIVNNSNGNFIHLY